METRRVGLGVVVMMVALSIAQEAAGAQAVRASRPKRSVVAEQIDEVFKIDGRLDEPFWRLVRPAGRFVQIEPREGDVPSKVTDVRMVFTDDAVIIGARMEDDGHLLAETVASAKDEADAKLPDYFRVQIDPHRDHRTAFEFVVTVRGETRAGLTTASGTSIDSWTVKWDAAMFVDENGWSVEIKIPLSEMHVEKGNEEWGVAFQRFSWKRMETDVLDGRKATSRVAMRDSSSRRP